ncbi:GNAT family N-acetyltransferase [Poseidonocella sp. HB161398]|uniref:GNAT family N-acetyltransferase n=1 Tax=Poseidonocella sp. HB161398 TaxID=2320855 RepID=UPI001107D107|nr:GNAT family N-acetyltransferase [Poseidonocella sp. HB161398]
MIRPALPEDETAIRACAEAAFARYVPLIGRRPAPMDAPFAAHIAAGRTHVATGPGGALAGYITFFPEDGAMHLDAIGVLPEAAGQGIGKALIAFCEAEARRQGFARVTLLTNQKMEANLSIYPHLGYAETGRASQDGFERVFFEKLLG